MTMTQAQIDELLKKLKSLLEEIKPLRERAAELETDLTQVQRDYDQKLSRLDAEASQLEVLRASLRARLQGRRQPPVPPSPPPLLPPELPPPVDTSPQQDVPPPPPEKRDPRAARKQALADHIHYFIGSDQEDIVQVINAVLVDDRRDVGDMLELLAWGDIWSARADWETLEHQHTRLEEWHRTLTDRLAYWQREVRRLEEDPRQDLVREMKARNCEEWLALLDGLVQQRKKDNERLKRELEVLKQALQEKQTESEVKDG